MVEIRGRSLGKIAAQSGDPFAGVLALGVAFRGVADAQRRVHGTVIVIVFQRREVLFIPSPRAVGLLKLPHPGQRGPRFRLELAGALAVVQGQCCGNGDDFRHAFGELDNPLGLKIALPFSALVPGHNPLLQKLPRFQ